MLPSVVIGSVQTGFEMRARFAAPLSTVAGARADATPSAANSKTAVDAASASTAKAGELTAQEQRQVAQLQEIDRQVRAHEQAHLSVGADLVRGGASFTYQSGPDDKRYAVAGEVSIDVSPAATPQETIPKAAHIRATALAPADPSSQDQSVAVQAERMAGEARIELAVQQREAALSAEQGSSRFYPGGDGSNSRLGGRLNLFA